MAIDAVIERIRQRDEGLRLELAPRVDAQGQDTCHGRPALTILGEHNVEPQVGMVVWGGASFVQIGADGWFDRKGTRLREQRACPRCAMRMHRAEIYNEETEARRECFRCDDCGEEEPLS